MIMRHPHGVTQAQKIIIITITLNQDGVLLQITITIVTITLGELLQMILLLILMITSKQNQIGVAVTTIINKQSPPIGVIKTPQ